ncbi:MAG: peptidase M14, partial [Bacteroidales bacterium]|nr:peptidase M14 [Bacteroidales bacterium]
MKKSINILAVSILLLVVQQVTAQTGGFSFKAAGSPSDPKVAATWNKYYTYEGITDLCNRLVKAYPGLITMESAGKSYEGREMIVLTITDKSKGSHMSKPAYWVDGNIHGNEIQGTEMALYTAWYLCEMYGRNEFITDLLAEKTIYIAPTINPDARAVFTGTAGSLRSGVVPRDDDRDGLVDEDGFDDLNGDREISMMRRKTTDGNLKSDPSDPRKMVPVAPGEKGVYEIVGREGIDNDGDGLLNEDGPGSYDPNRDWGYNWEPNYVQNGADKYPFSLPETRAIRDFITSHPNITGSQSFHNSGEMILKGPSVEGGGSEIYSRTDDMVYESIGRTGEKIIPGYRLLTIWKDM